MKINIHNSIMNSSKLILITGMTGSGKSTLSKQIQSTYNNITKISLDWFYKDIPDSINPSDYNFDDPIAIDWLNVRNQKK